MLLLGLFGYLLMLVGLAGTLLPLIPGTPLILIGATVHAAVGGFSSDDVRMIVILALLAAGAQLGEYVAGAWAARRGGASWQGVVGAVLGGLVGLFALPVVGVLIGPLVGAILGELLSGKKSREATRAGLGALIGVLGGILLQFAVGLAMVGMVVVRITLG